MSSADLPNGAEAVVCNPLNLPYRFQDVRPLLPQRRSVHREAADPTIVVFNGRFLLFASMSGGFWYSDDLVDWSYHATPDLPVYEYAPDVREIDGYLYFSASPSFGRSSFHRTRDPFEGGYERIDPGFGFFDPNLFQDDDGRVYFYWGCSGRAPIYGVELDRATMAPVQERVALIAGHVDRHGWEQPGEDHDPQQRTAFSKLVGKAMGDTFIEGAWMTKHDGTYYLQYAAPATEVNTYADGYCTASSPLGPFTYSPDSPFSSKPGGFINGAGHGSTFQDHHGNWWHTSTMRISVRHMFERRIGLFPAGFDEDGVLFCNQNFADYPMIVPDGPFDPWKDAFPGWMLLSYKKPVTALSSAKGHGPDLAVNEDVRTWWAAGRAEPGQWLSVDLGEVRTVRAVQVNLAEHDVRAPKPPKREFVTLDRRYIDTEPRSTEYLLETSVDGATWAALRDTRGSGEDVPHDFVVADEPLQARFVRVTGYRMPHGSTFAISGLRVFGSGAGEAPAAVTARAVRRGPLAARVSWHAVPGAQGYNVRYGRSPEKLYHSWLVYEQDELELTGLNAGVDYHVAVDAFNENGVTEGVTVPVPSPGTRGSHVGEF